MPVHPSGTMPSPWGLLVFTAPSIEPQEDGRMIDKERGAWMNPKELGMWFNETKHCIFCKN